MAVIAHLRYLHTPMHDYALDNPIYLAFDQQIRHASYLEHSTHEFMVHIQLGEAYIAINLARILYRLNLL